MQFSKNTRMSSRGTSVGFFIKVILILFVIIGAIIVLSKVDFPSPSKKIEKIIPNEKLKIVK
jgi:hypothetical protein|tara:strand:- start:1630 stop:1815 length:186 start_codon:yes stop_codon:yes gene_type:complete